MRISYLGKDLSGFKCDTCGKLTKAKFKAIPSLPDLVDWTTLSICRNCAKREVGSKGYKKKLEIIMEAYNEQEKTTKELSSKS